MIPPPRDTDRGASSVEYGLLLAGVTALIVLAVFGLGPVVNEMFTDTCDNVHAQMEAPTTTC